MAAIWAVKSFLVEVLQRQLQGQPISSSTKGNVEQKRESQHLPPDFLYSVQSEMFCYRRSICKEEDKTELKN